ncbi:MAG: DUF3971 domain-containing protein [Gammaproteobacteria bacterium]
MTQRGILRRSLGWLAGSAAALLILLAVLVGIARLLLPLAPDYQDDIRRFASEATGFDIRFGRLSASWPLRGPEVRFTDVRIATRNSRRAVLDAGELSVGVDLWRLVLERRLRPGRIMVSGASVRAERNPAGQWLVNGVPLEELLRRPRNEPLPRLDLKLRNIEILVLDETRLEPRLPLFIDTLDLDLGPERLVFEAEFDGREGLGKSVDVSGTLPVALLRTAAAPGAGQPQAAGPEAWEFTANGPDLDLARWFRLVANEPVPLVSGRGAVNLRAGFLGLKPTRIAVDLDLGPTVWEGVTKAANNYQHLEFQADWQSLPDGWEATLGKFVVERGKGTSPAGTGSLRYVEPGANAGSFTAAADNLRLQDLWPVLWSVASTGLRRDLLPEQVQGEVRNLRIKASFPAGRPPTWVTEASVRDLGVVMPEPGWALTGITGTVRADEAGGNIRLDSRAGLVRLPTLFRADIRTTLTTGQLGWKQTERGLEVFGDELKIATADVESQSRVQIIFPPVGPVYVDIAARFVASSAPAALNYLPLMKFKPGVVQWLDRALVAGSVPRAEFLWQGPLRGFPYEAGDGRFRAEFTLADAVIDYAAEWPRLENASGTVVIDRVSLVSLENRGSIGGLPFADAKIRVPNLFRDAELDVTADDPVQLGQILSFLQQTPVAAALGPALGSATGSGDVAVAVDLRLPLADPKSYRLTGTFGLAGARLGLKGVDFSLSALQGAVRLDRDRLVADKVAGRFLDEPVSIALRAARADEPDLTQVAEVQGETPADKVAAAFSLPYAEKLAGTLAWAATVRVPARSSGQPLRIEIASDLEQLASALPKPLTKLAGTPEALRMKVSLPDRDKLQVSGTIERGVSWALQFLPGSRARVATDTRERQGRAGWQLERGSLRSGRRQAELPDTRGLEIGGDFASLRFEDWFPGRGAGGGPNENSTADLVRKINLDVGSLAILGRLFRDVRLDASRQVGEWRVAVRSPSAAGTVTVPVGTGDDAPVVLDMQRLALVETDPGTGEGKADPRNLPAVRATIADFTLKDMRLGSLRAEIAQRGDGIVVDPLVMESPTFRINGDATWVVEDGDVRRQRSELRLQLRSKKIGPTLKALGYEAVVEGEKAGVDLGSGRFVGLLSIAALPRRLGLDFSDVVNKGLAFDQVKGEFRLEGGNAFTCNFGLEGPVTDIGIVGRVSLRDRSYDQIAVVRPHVSDVLAVGGFVGGPVVGGTVLLISQLFRKPLSSLGETYYRVSGPWDQPVVDKVQKNEVDLAPFGDCERYLAEVLKELPPEAELTR